MPRRKNLDESDHDEEDETYNDDSVDEPAGDDSSNDDYSEPSVKGKPKTKPLRQVSPRQLNPLRNNSSRLPRGKKQRLETSQPMPPLFKTRKIGSRAPRIAVPRGVVAQKKEKVEKDDSYSGSESNPQSEDEVDAEDDDDFHPPTSSDDESESDDDDKYASEESEPKRRSQRTRLTPARKVTRSNSKRSGSQRKSQQNYNLSDSSDDESSEEIKKSSSKRTRQHTTRKNRLMESSDDETKDKNFSRTTPRQRKTFQRSDTRNRRPQRSSASLLYNDSSSTKSAEEEDDDYRPRSKNKAVDRAKNKAMSSGKDFSEEEEEFLLNDCLESDGDIANASDQSDIVLRKSRLRRKVSCEIGYIDEEKLGESDVEDDTKAERKPPAQARLQNLSTSPIIPYCPSTEDVITLEKLPKKHICFFPPDQSSRQCFCLSTLRKIALCSEQPKFPIDLTGGKQTFLQPPHFRAPMSDDLLDQIASRFGREALDLNGPFYHRNQSALLQDESYDEYAGRSEKLLNSSAFMEQVQNYVRTVMGSRDIYVCPVCFTVAHQHLKEFMDSDKTQRKKAADSEDKYTTDFAFDPMAILGYEDNDAFEIASAFCFNKAADVKEHLCREHKIDTKVVKGNDLYSRFKIRAPDGLLQQYLNRIGNRTHGTIMSYWFEGNNFSFVQLLSQIPYSATCTEIVDVSLQRNEEESEDENTMKAHAYLKPALDFFHTFADDTADIWELVSSPFQQVRKEEFNEFIAADEEEIGDDNAMYQAFNHSSALVEQAENERAVAYYEARGHEDSEAISEEEYGEIDNTGLIFEDDSVEYDEEENQSSSNDERPRPTRAQRKRQNERMTDFVVGKQSLSPSKYRRIAHNSPTGFEEKKSSEEDSSPGNVSAPSRVKMNGSIRKRLVINESEEE